MGTPIGMSTIFGSLAGTLQVSNLWGGLQNAQLKKIHKKTLKKNNSRLSFQTPQQLRSKFAIFFWPETEILRKFEVIFFEVIWGIMGYSSKLPSKSFVKISHQKPHQRIFWTSSWWHMANSIVDRQKDYNTWVVWKQRVFSHQTSRFFLVRGKKVNENDEKMVEFFKDFLGVCILTILISMLTLFEFSIDVDDFCTVF